MTVGRRHDPTGRSTTRFASSKFRKLNAPPRDQPWAWLPRDLLQSYAWRSLSCAGRKIIDRLLIEHLSHGGADNGALPVTYEDFTDYGVHTSSILPALAEVSALGLVQRTQAGLRAYGEFKGVSALYRLAWLPDHTGGKPLTAWQRFTCLAEAKGAVRAARSAVDDGRAAKREDTENIDSPPECGVESTPETGVGPSLFATPQSGVEALRRVGLGKR
jgi:hypothetical protein